MDALPLLETLTRALHRVGLEAILIGNAAAALRGAPVTTVDFDFFFRKTPQNLKKLKALAKELDAVLMRPYYPVSGLYRLIRDDDGLQADFMARIHGVRSFEILLALRPNRSRRVPAMDRGPGPDSQKQTSRGPAAGSSRLSYSGKGSR